MITMSCTPEYLLKKYTEELAELEKSQKELEESYEKHIALDKQLDAISCANDKIKVIDTHYPNEDDIPF